MKRITRREGAALAVVAAGLAGAAAWSEARREREVVLARFATSLRGRTPNQAHNATLAARSVHGRWIRPGAVFSFNGAVGSWSSETGYRRAPVSFDGELVPSWGGGVCQASSTLYNAALLAGLTVVERHRHRWIPGYVAPGRDAAVADGGIDLRLRNPHPWPVRIEAAARGDVLELRVVGRRRPGARWEIRQRMETVSDPVVIRQAWREGMSTRRVRNPGKRGCRVRTYRVRMEGAVETRRELLSDDAYPAMNRLVLEL